MHESLKKLRFSELWLISHPAITTLLWLFCNCSTTQSHLHCTEAKLCNDCKGESGVSARAKLMNDHSRGTIGTNVSSRRCGSLDTSLKNLHQKNGSQRFNKDMWVEVTVPVFPKQDWKPLPNWRLSPLTPRNVLLLSSVRNDSAVVQGVYQLPLRSAELSHRFWLSPFERCSNIVRSKLSYNERLTLNTWRGNQYDAVTCLHAAFCWWSQCWDISQGQLLQEEERGNRLIIRIHPLWTMNVFTSFHYDQSNSFWPLNRWVLR